MNMQKRLVENNVCRNGLIDGLKEEEIRRQIRSQRLGGSMTINNEIKIESCPEAEIELCQKFIRQFMLKRGEKAKDGYSSYTLKHSVERYYKTYISNGSFIIAAIREGARQTDHLLINTLVFLKFTPEYKKLSKKTNGFTMEG